MKDLHECISSEDISLANPFLITLLAGRFIRIMLTYLVDALSIASSCALHFHTVTSWFGPFLCGWAPAPQKAWHSSFYLPCSRKLHQ